MSIQAVVRLHDGFDLSSTFFLIIFVFRLHLSTVTSPHTHLTSLCIIVLYQKLSNLPGDGLCIVLATYYVLIHRATRVEGVLDK